MEKPMGFTSKYQAVLMSFLSLFSFAFMEQASSQDNDITNVVKIIDGAQTKTAEQIAGYVEGIDTSYITNSQAMAIQNEAERLFRIRDVDSSYKLFLVVGHLVEKEDLKRDLLAGSYTGQGWCMSIYQKWNRSITCYELALDVARKHNLELSFHARIKSNLGHAYKRVEGIESALKCFDEARTDYKAAENPNGVAEMSNARGALFSSLGRLNEAYFEYEKALKEATTPMGMAPALVNLAQLHVEWGQYGSALERINNAKNVVENIKVPDDLVEAETIRFKRNMARGLAIIHQTYGRIYEGVGNSSESKRYHQLSLQNFEDIDDKIGIGHQNNNLGVQCLIEQQFEKAEEYFRESEKIFSKQNPLLAINPINNFGNAIVQRLLSSDIEEVKQSEYASAIKMFEKALALSIASKNLIQEYQIRGDFSRALLYAGRLNDALLQVETAIGIANKINATRELWIYQTLLGDINLALDNSAVAKENYKQACNLIDQQQQSLFGDFSTRVNFFSDKTKPYEQLIKIFTNENDVENSLIFAERSKSRILISAILTDLGEDADFVFSKQFGELRKQSINLHKELTAVLLKMELKSGPQTVEANNEVNSELSDKKDKIITLLESNELQLKSLLDTMLKIGAANLEKYAIEDVREFAKKSPDTALLQFVFTEANPIVFSVAKIGQEVQFDAVVLDTNSEELKSKIQDFNSRVSTAAKGYQSSGRWLYAKLIRPVQKSLEGKREIIVVPDGIIWQLPFSCLLNDEKEFLVETHSVSYANSFRSLLAQMAVTNKNTVAKPNNNGVFAVGSPNRPDLESLESASFEAKEIVKICGGPPNSLALTGSEATETAFFANANNHSIVHVAAHGKISSDSPLNSKILLSKEIEAESRIDGELTGYDLIEKWARLQAACVICMFNGQRRVEQRRRLYWFYMGDIYCRLSVSYRD